MGWNQRALEERLAGLPAAEREELRRRASRLRDEARRQARTARGGARKGSGRHGDLPPWAGRLRDADLHLWMLHLLEDALVVEEEEEDLAAHGRPGVVVWAGRKVCRLRVEEPDGPEEIEATLSGPLARAQRALLAVGDEVLWEGEGGHHSPSAPRRRANDAHLLPADVPDAAGPGSPESAHGADSGCGRSAGRAPRGARVLRVLPRRSALSRPDPHNPNLERVIVANLDLGVIVIAARSPIPRPRLIDRYLVVMERGGVAPLLCVNKVDQVRDEADRAGLEALLAPYEALALPVLTCSAKTGEGVDALRARLLGRTSALLGHSGVGKSSLINAMFPHLAREVGALDALERGRHTTSASTLLDLGDGTRLIDTPGVRSLGLGRLEPAELRWYFPEFAALAEGCAYRDCTHDHEPGCAVLAAAAAGELPAARLDSYHRLLRSMDEEAP